MASGTIKGTKKGYYGVEIDWVATKNSASANTSTVVSKVYITYYSINIAGRTATSSINGVSVSFSVPAINDKPNSSTRRLIYTHTATVAHNTDGTKTGVTISASFPFNLSSSTYGEIGTLSASKAVDFDAIARTSALSIPSTTLTTDTAFTATITKPDSTFRSKLAVLIDGTQKAITDYFTATSYSYKIPSSLIPSANSDVMVLRLYTYTSSGTTALGYVDKSVTVNVLSTLQPTVSITAAISSGGLNGYYVQNKSVVKLTVSSTESSGSTIKSYTFTGPNVNSSTSADSVSVSSTAKSYSLTTGTIKSTGTLTYKVTVYDARGRYATDTVDIYVYPYALPEITTASIQRCNASGELAKDGTYVKYTINSKFSPVLVGTTINNWRTVTLCHSSDGGTTYGSVTTLQAKTTTDLSVTGKYGDGAILTTNAYKFKIVITDQYGATDTEYVNLGSIERPMNIAKYGNGVSIGGFSSVTSATADGKFECHWGADFKDGVTISNGLTVNGAISAPNGISTSSFSTLTGYKMLNAVNLNTITFAGTYGCLNCTNKPTSSYTYGMLEVIMYSSQWLIQRYRSINSDGSWGYIYERMYYGGTTWTDWTAQYTASKAVNGYYKTPMGVIIQWGTASIAASTSSLAITFPIAFPGRCTSVMCQNVYSNARNILYSVAGVGLNGFTAYPYYTNTNAVPTAAMNFHWFAIGY